MVQNQHAEDPLGYRSINFIHYSKWPSGSTPLIYDSVMVWRSVDESTKEWLLDICGSMMTINLPSEIPADPDRKSKESDQDNPTQDMETPRATAFDALLASNDTIETFTLRIGECSRLMGADMEVTTSDDPGQIETLNPSTGRASREQWR